MSCSQNVLNSLWWSWGGQTPASEPPPVEEQSVAPPRLTVRTLHPIHGDRTGALSVSFPALERPAMRCWAGASIVKGTRTDRRTHLPATKGENCVFDIISREARLCIFWQLGNQCCLQQAEWVARMGWSLLSPPQCRIVNDVGRKKQHFVFLCRNERCREILSVRYLTYRGAVGMKLLHDLLHILACILFPPKNSRCTDFVMF